MYILHELTPVARHTSLARISFLFFYIYFMFAVIPNAIITGAHDAMNGSTGNGSGSNDDGGG